MQNLVQEGRYAQDSLHINPDAELRHFIPLMTKDIQTVSRDRFGNRVFMSPQYSYFDRGGKETKAAMLISQQGESFVKTNEGILNDIDRGLRLLVDRPYGGIDLGNKRALMRLTLGSQSDVYKLEVGDVAYVVKTKNKKMFEDQSQGVWQPYINEMLQTQSISVDLQEQLRQIGVVMPSFLFASGQVACVQFEKGREPNAGELKAKEQRLIPIVSGYIQKEKSERPDLWQNIVTDSRVDNYVKRADGKLVWIDPFQHFKIPV